MISVIITAYKEAGTIGKAIEAVLQNNLKEKYEILVVAPDDETLNVARAYAKTGKVTVVKDKGIGKSPALNLAVSKAKGDLLVLTDGDVYISKNSLKPLLDYFQEEKVGAVSGNPVSLNPKNNVLGFWAYLLTSIADERRKKALLQGKKFYCSGYLFAIRKKLFPKLPEELLSEDGYISNKVYEQGYAIKYSENSKVYVLYPTTFSDWIKQKKRSAGGYNQIKKMTRKEIRSFKKESLGAVNFFKFASNPVEFAWLILLFLARVYLWLLIYIDINLRKKSRKEIWKRVESTKSPA